MFGWKQPNTTKNSKNSRSIIVIFQGLPFFVLRRLQIPGFSRRFFGIFQEIFSRFFIRKSKHTFINLNILKKHIYTTEYSIFQSCIRSLAVNFMIIWARYFFTILRGKKGKPTWYATPHDTAKSLPHDRCMIVPSHSTHFLLWKIIMLLH